MFWGPLPDAIQSAVDRLRTYAAVVDKVFISSVMRGFEDERAAARRAVESVGLRAVMAETAPARPDASKHALLDLVDPADAVVLILGARYGYIAEHGLSPTEDEFNHARQAGKPIFVFVQNGVLREPEQDELGYSQDKAEKSISWLDSLAANCGSGLVGVVRSGSVGRVTDRCGWRVSVDGVD